jgi:hypothetical protein
MGSGPCFCAGSPEPGNFIRHGALVDCRLGLCVHAASQNTQLDRCRQSDSGPQPQPGKDRADGPDARSLQGLGSLAEIEPGGVSRPDRPAAHAGRGHFFGTDGQDDRADPSIEPGDLKLHQLLVSAHMGILVALVPRHPFDHGPGGHRLVAPGLFHAADYRYRHRGRLLAAEGHGYFRR